MQYFHCVLILQNNLAQYLLRYIQNNYDQSVTVTTSQIECINISTAIFKLQFTGHTVNDTLLQLQNDTYNSGKGLNIGIGILKLCKKNCTVRSDDDDDDGNSNDNDNDGDKNKIFVERVFIVAVVVVVVILLLSVIVICCLIITYKRYV